MTRRDRDALTRAMEIARRDPLRAEQLDSMLEDRTWAEVAEFAAYCVQGDALHLATHQTPPCCLDVDGADDDGRNDAGRALLRRMLKAGLSRFEPDPLGALAAARKPAA